MAESECQEDVAATVAVEIMGVSYTLREDMGHENSGREDSGADAQRIRDLAKKVDRKMRAVAERLPDLDTARIAILAALNLAAESSREAEAPDGRFVEMVERVSSLASELEAALDS